MTDKPTEPAEQKKKRTEAVSEFLKLLYQQTDVLIFSTKAEAIALLEEAAEDMHHQQYARDCLSFKESQSKDMNSRIEMLRATIAFLKARKLHIENLQDAGEIEKAEKEFDSMIESLI